MKELCLTETHLINDFFKLGKQRHKTWPFSYIYLPVCTKLYVERFNFLESTPLLGNKDSLRSPRRRALVAYDLPQVHSSASVCELSAVWQLWSQNLLVARPLQPAPHPVSAVISSGRPLRDPLQEEEVQLTDRSIIHLKHFFQVSRQSLKCSFHSPNRINSAGSPFSKRHKLSRQMTKCDFSPASSSSN